MHAPLETNAAWEWPTCCYDGCTDSAHDDYDADHPTCEYHDTEERLEQQADLYREGML